MRNSAVCRVRYGPDVSNKQVMQVYVCCLFRFPLAADMLSHPPSQLTLPSSDATRLWATVLKVPKMLLA
jgi:hypothetical protein